MARIVRVCAIALLILLFCGCVEEQANEATTSTAAPTTITHPPQTYVSQTTTTVKQTTTLKGHSTTTTAASHTSPEDTAAVAAANNRFAVDLYRKFAEKEGNMFFSPFSILTALTMTYEGAGGKTAQEMREVLHLPEDKAALRSSFSAINSAINADGKPYELATANAIWPEKGFDFLPAYTQTLRDFYGSEATPLDYATNAEGSRVTINKWVEERTREKIKDLIPPGVLNPMTRMVLTNAIYFKGDWARQFNKNLTSPMEFRTGSGKKVQADMMRDEGGEERRNYYESENLQMLELPYKGDELSMLVILPPSDDIGGIEGSLSAENIDTWRKSMRPERVDVYLPKFKLEKKYMMADTLRGLGMAEAFTMAADFSGMDGRKDLFISQVIHQSYVKVDEEGTEAAAATAVVMTATGMPTRPKVFRADHPFIFIIQDKKSGNILFMGRVDDPSA
jgi:serpin B